MARRNGRKNGREEALDWLTTNLGADALDRMQDGELTELANNHQFAAEKTLVCNALAELFPDVNDVVANGGDLKAFLKQKMGGKGQQEEDDEDEDDMYGENAGSCGGEMKGENGAGAVGSGGPDSPAVKASASASDRLSGNSRHVRNRQRKSFTEMLAESGDAEAQSVWNHAVENERNERAGLLRRITANCDKAEAKALWDSLKGSPLPTLKLLANQRGQERGEDRGPSGLFGIGRRIPDYAGAAGSVAGMTGNRGRDEDDDTLDLPDARAILANEQQHSQA